MGNGGGVSIAGPNNTIEGTKAGAGNVISCNNRLTVSTGIYISDLGATGNRVQGDFIGTQVDGTNPLGNSWHGGRITALASKDTIGGTVTVVEDDTPVVGVAVDFSVISGPNTGLTKSYTTNTIGQASFAYTNNGMEGTDIIKASGWVEATPFSCRATKTWGELACAVTPALATNLVGTTHTVTVTVTISGTTVPSIDVEFNVASGPNTGQSGSDTTDANGQARFTYTSSGTRGSDTIEATGMVTGIPFNCTGRKTWIPETCSPDVPKDIPDERTTTSTLTIDNSLVVADVNVGFFIEHTYGSDLEVTLTSPNGTTVQLFTGVGGSRGI